MKRRLLLLAPLAVVLAVVLVSRHRPDYTDLPRLDPIQVRIPLNDRDRRGIARHIRRSLADLAHGRRPEPFATGIRLPGPTQAFLAVFLDGVPPLESRSAPGPLDGCLEEAARALAADPRFAGEFAGRIGEMRLRVDLLKRREYCEVPELDATRASVEAGRHGLILQTPRGLVYQPPWDIHYRGWDVPDGRGRRKRRLVRQFERLSEAAGLGQDGWRRAHVYRFRTDAFVQLESGARPLVLYRSNVLPPDAVGPREVREGLREISNWLAANLDQRGRFTYLYDPIADETNHPLHYGIVRHAGAVYGLYAVFGATGDARYLEAADRALGYLNTVTRPPLRAPELLSVRQNGISLLGASALALLALCEKPADLRSPDDEDTMRRLAGFLLRMQLEDGAYYTFYLQALVGCRPRRQARYFPGESLLALVRYAEEIRNRGGTPDGRRLTAIERAADFQIGDFERTGKPDNWTIQALSRLHALTGEDRYAGACLAMAAVLTDSQYGIGRRVRYRDYRGGYANTRPPRTTPTASRTEATSAAWDLAVRTGHPDAAVLADSVRQAAWFILGNRFRPQNSYYLPDPARARGGVRGGLVDNRIRVDYNQHAVIALLGALRVLESRD